MKSHLKRRAHSRCPSQRRCIATLISAAAISGACTTAALAQTAPPASNVSLIGTTPMTASLTVPMTAPLTTATATPTSMAMAMPMTMTSTVVITGNPLGRDSAAQPSSVLTGEGLVLRRASTLGETLDGLPGVSASWFGPNSSRPVLRGLDGDRVRLLDNGGASVDASNLSFDHAVGIDPLVAERLEVLRGPAALLYGGNATGGVVNSMNNRVPRVAATALSGRAELRLGGAARERSAAAVLEGGGPGGSGLNWHADVFSRTSGDQRAPHFVPVEGGQPLPPSTVVRNSAAQASGGAVGAGWVGEHGFLGAAVDTYSNRYGVTAEPDVRIDLKRHRLEVAGEARALNKASAGWLSRVWFQASHTDYQHQEVEGDGAVGTTFKSRGSDFRAQVQHAPLLSNGLFSGLEGVWGVQAEKLDFSALGEEAFVPGTHSRSAALFVLEELKLGAWVLSAGARLEQARVNSEGDGNNADEPRFGSSVERRFTPKSSALGALAELGGGWQFNAALSRNQRAPAYYELYANGAHLATGAFERGDPRLAVERSQHAELGLRWKKGTQHLSATLFRTRFANFIALDATGKSVAGPDDSSLPEYTFAAVPARLVGLEVDGRWQLHPAVGLTAGVDTLRGDNLATGEGLPRQPPLRWRVGLDARVSGINLGLNLRHNARQSRVPSTDSPTPGYTLLDLSASGPLPTFAQGALWFVKLGNASNRLAYNAGTVATLRGLAPLPGRALSAGVNVRF